MDARVVVAVAALVAGCASPGVTRPDARTSPTTVTGGMVPGSCAEVPYGTIAPATAPLSKGQTATAGIAVRRGRGDYVIDEVRVEVLPPGSDVMQAPGGPDPLVAPHADAARTLERHDVAAADTRFTVSFDGTDTNGASLSPGRYAVVFEMASSAAPGSSCPGPPVRVEGVLGEIDWRG